MNLELVILDGPQAGRRLPVNATPRTIGRTTSSEVSFPDDNFLSGVHLSVQAEALGILIRDLNSRNGTFLNGQRISQAVAEIGDVLQAGTMSLQVALASAAPPVPQPVSQPLPPAVGAAATAFQLPAMDIPAPPLAGATTTIPTIAVGLPQSGLPRLGPSVRRPPSQAVPELLAAIQAPVLALVNSEASETIQPYLEMGIPNVRQYAVWEGNAISVPSWVPYLLPVTPQSLWLRPLLDQGWDKGFLSFLVSSVPGSEVQKHFAKFLSVQVGSGNGVYFRFYDPAVTREFLPTAAPGELAMFLGPVEEWILAATAPGSVLRVRNSPGGVVTATTVL